MLVRVVATPPSMSYRKTVTLCTARSVLHPEVLSDRFAASWPVAMFSLKVQWAAARSRVDAKVQPTAPPGSIEWRRVSQLEKWSGMGPQLASHTRPGRRGT